MKKNYDYINEDIISSLKNTGLEKGNSIFVHSNLGYFGQLKNANSIETLCKIFEESIFEVIGEKGTLIVPTFSLSFCNNQVYDKINTPSLECGIFSEYIRKNIPRKYKNRILIAYGENREKMLNKHKSSNLPTVLISPSMAEGVDLKGNLSKFQIICKIPFPYLGDKVVKKKMAKWNWWYDVSTIRTVIQSIGRSIRSETDTAVTYILDSDWKRLYSKSKKMLPKDFEKSYYES